MSNIDQTKLQEITSDKNKLTDKLTDKEITNKLTEEQSAGNIWKDWKEAKNTVMTIAKGFKTSIRNNKAWLSTKSVSFIEKRKNLRHDACKLQYSFTD